MTTARAPRVAIVGVRRVRTGLGQFFAKHLVAAGAEVPAFIASRKETIEEGHWSLRQVGVNAEGYVELDSLLDAHPTVEALVVASPHVTHRAWLDAAIERGLHVLCEKPFVWGDPSPSWEADRIVELALRRGIALFESCPSPYTLPAFDALHPRARADAVTTFEMEMAPSSTSPREMLVDALSHPLSVLQELAPRGDATIGSLRWGAVEEGRVELSFSFGQAATRIASAVRLRSVATQPRPMALTLNGFRADRRVRMTDYSLVFADGAREVPLPDPMASLVAEFVRTLRDGEPAPTCEARLLKIRRRAALLEQIVGSFPGP